MLWMVFPLREDFTEVKFKVNNTPILIYLRIVFRVWIEFVLIIITSDFGGIYVKRTQTWGLTTELSNSICGTQQISGNVIYKILKDVKATKKQISLLGLNKKVY